MGRVARPNEGLGSGVPASFPDFTPDDWARVVAASDSPTSEARSYDEWRQQRDEAAAYLRRVGVPVRLVPVDADAYLAWLDRRRLPNVPASRDAYVRERLRGAEAGAKDHQDHQG